MTKCMVMREALISFANFCCNWALAQKIGHDVIFGGGALSTVEQQELLHLEKNNPTNFYSFYDNMSVQFHGSLLVY